MLEPEYKVNIYVKIAQLFLEDDESVQAEAYINRGSIVFFFSSNFLASELITLVKDDMLKLRYKVDRFLSHFKRIGVLCKDYGL